MLSNKQLIYLQSIAEEAALKAGELIVNFPRKDLKIDSKAGAASIASEVVTQVDLLAQDLILAELASSIKSYDLGVLTEESVDDLSRLEKDYFWCIDPIDGTLAFTRDTKGYSVSIALISKSGFPIIGVVYNPVDKDLYSGAKGLGVLKNGKKWTTGKKQKSTFICDPTFVGHPKYDSTIEEFKKERTSKVEVIAIGGAVMNAIWTIENAPALYAKAPKPKKGGGSIWDYAATTCIYRELGLEAGDYEGNTLSFNDTESIYFNHCGIRFSSL